MSKERWLAAKGYPGYEVSDAGRVRNAAFGGHILTPVKTRNGYMSLALGRKHLNVSVHRLVASHFVKGDTNLEVNHKDGDRTNNRSDNLEWVTRSENIQHSYDTLPRKQHGLTQPVRVGGVDYESMLAAAKAVGVSVGSIGSAIRKGHRCKGMDVTYA